MNRYKLRCTQCKSDWECNEATHAAHLNGYGRCPHCTRDYSTTEHAKLRAVCPVHKLAKRHPTGTGARLPIPADLKGLEGSDATEFVVHPKLGTRVPMLSVGLFTSRGSVISWESVIVADLALVEP